MKVRGQKSKRTSRTHSQNAVIYTYFFGMSVVKLNKLMLVKNLETHECTGTVETQIVNVSL